MIKWGILSVLLFLLAGVLFATYGNYDRKLTLMCRDCRKRSDPFLTYKEYKKFIHIKDNTITFYKCPRCNKERTYFVIITKKWNGNLVLPWTWAKNTETIKEAIL